MRTLFDKFAEQIWTHEVRPEEVRIGLSRSESIPPDRVSEQH